MKLVRICLVAIVTSFLFGLVFNPYDNGFTLMVIPWFLFNCAMGHVSYLHWEQK